MGIGEVCGKLNRHQKLNTYFDGFVGNAFLREYDFVNITFNVRLHVSYVKKKKKKKMTDTFCLAMQRIGKVGYLMD
jgi:hypothetical protein